jgi:hypothetical protein
MLCSKQSNNSSTLSGFKMSNVKEFAFRTFQQLSILILMIDLNYKSQPKKCLMCK